MRTLILGATGNLGSALADVLSSNGHRLVLHGHSQSDKLIEIATRVGAEGCHCADVTSEAEMGELFAAVGQLDAVVYCVGINPTADSVAVMDLANWRRTLEVNLTGAFIATKLAIAALRGSSAPSIVLVSSIFGDETPARRAAYGASKHGLRALVQAVTREEGPWLRINAVCPGPMWSDNVREIFEKHAAAAGITMEEYVLQRVSDIPAGRFMELSECADLVSFLLSQDARFVQGECVRISGGAIQ